MFSIRFLFLATLYFTAFISGHAQQCEGETTGEHGECANTDAVDEAPQKIDESCPDRDHLMRCASEYLDKNKNGKLDRDELSDAISSLPW